MHERIMLVEDDPIFGGFISKQIEREGIQCVWVRTFEEAKSQIHQAKGQGFHAIVTDIFLEEGARLGLDLVRDAESAGLPTIVISSRADLGIAKEAMNLGARGLIEKPFDAKALRESLNRIWQEPSGLSGIVDHFFDTHELTSKEKEVGRLILKGLSNKEIAGVLGNTEKTIKHHITVMFEKCEVKSRTELFNAIFPT